MKTDQIVQYSEIHGRKPHLNFSRSHFIVCHSVRVCHSHTHSTEPMLSVLSLSWHRMHFTLFTASAASGSAASGRGWHQRSAPERITEPSGWLYVTDTAPPPLPPPTHTNCGICVVTQPMAGRQCCWIVHINHLLRIARGKCCRIGQNLPEIVFELLDIKQQLSTRIIFPFYIYRFGTIVNW